VQLVALADPGQIEAWLTNVPPCLIGMEPCVGAHHLIRKLQSQATKTTDQLDLRALHRLRERLVPVAALSRRQGARPG
jgi:hypothetical protein